MSLLKKTIESETRVEHDYMKYKHKTAHSNSFAYEFILIYIYIYIYIKLTPQNKIYYWTLLKRTILFRYPYKKRKWPNHHRYLPQTHRHPSIAPLQKPSHKNCMKSIPYTLALCLSKETSCFPESLIVQIFIIQRVKARAIPCPHQPPTRGDNTFGSSRRYCHSLCYQTAFATGRVFKRIIYIYIYTPGQRYIYIYIL